MVSSRAFCVFVAALSLLAACSSDESGKGSPEDVGAADAGVDAAADSGGDTALDATRDAAADVAHDTAVDTGSDATDGGGDTGIDAAADAADDAGPDDAGPDAASDTSADANPPAPPSVEPLYPANGANWNQWVDNDGASPLAASDTACNLSSVGTAADPCVHGGELRSVELAAFSDCSGVTISDDLGAFEWICDDSGATVRAISTGLNDASSLSDLLDFSTAPPAWKLNSVTATDGSTSVSTTPAAWWSNPIVVDEDGGTLATAGTIYVITTDATAHYRVSADEAALVVAPGATLTGDGGFDELVDFAGDCGWIEGNFAGPGQDTGIYGNGADLLVMRNVEIANLELGPGIDLNGADSVRAFNINTHNNDDEGLIVRGNYGRFRTIVTADNDDDGDPDPLVAGVLVLGDGNHFEDVTSTNDAVQVGDGSSAVRGTEVRHMSIGGSRLLLDSARDGFYRDVAVHAPGLTGNNALELSGSSYGNVLYDILVEGGGSSSGYAAFTDENNVFVRFVQYNSNGYGTHLADSSSVMLGFVVSNSPEQRGLTVGSSTTMVGGLVRQTSDSTTPSAATGIYISGSDNYMRNMATTLSSGPGIYLASDNPATLSGMLFVDDIPGDCARANSADVGLPFDENCAVATGTNAGIAGGFNDQGVGAAPGFELATGSTILGVATLPGGDDTITHTLSDGLSSSGCGDIIDGAVWNAAISRCQVTFLRDAYEVADDGIGNDNGLCQSGESCMFMPNIGAYQGHGTVTAAGSIGTGTTIENVTLMKYGSNGR